MYEGINDIAERIKQLADEHGLDPTFSHLVCRLSRVLEKRMGNVDIPKYLGGLARDYHNVTSAR